MPTPTKSKINKILILVGSVIVLVFGCIYWANIQLGIISIAFPRPEKVAERYFEAVLAGSLDDVRELTEEEGFLCGDLTLELAQRHIEQFSNSEVKDENITAGYWTDAPTGFSPARQQIATISFMFRKLGETEWKSEKIRLSIWQLNWKYIVCGPPV